MKYVWWHLSPLVRWVCDAILWIDVRQLWRVWNNLTFIHLLLPTLWVCELLLNPFLSLSFPWNKLDAIVTFIYNFTLSLHEMLFVWMATQNKSLSWGMVKREGKWRSSKNSHLPMVLKKMEPLHTKKMNGKRITKMKKNKKIVKMINEMVHRKWIILWV